jgi:hypothetical protein
MQSEFSLIRGGCVVAASAFYFVLSFLCKKLGKSIDSLL